MTISRAPKISSPCCGEILDAQQHVGGTDTKPKAGDYTICFYCTKALRYGPALVLRVLTDEEEKTAPAGLFEAQSRLIKSKARNKAKSHEPRSSSVVGAVAEAVADFIGEIIEDD